jgi:hypothetical protein
MSRRLLCLTALFCTLLGAQTRPASAELERTEKQIQNLTGLKERVHAIEVELDEMLRVLSEQRGALATAPKYDAIQTAALAADSPDVKKQARCAAITDSHKRCSRMADEGSRYCWQHKVAHQK